MAGIPFFPIQEEEINHLFLILPAAGERCQEWIYADMGGMTMVLQGLYSGHLPWRIHRDKQGCPLGQLDLGTWSPVTKAPLPHPNILLR